MTAIRRAQVAGRFYPSDPEEITLLINQLADKERAKVNFTHSEKTILGAILPHAGHIYSGSETVHFFEVLKSSRQVFDLWIIIHPLHHVSETDYAAEDSDYWTTPLGNVKINKEFIEAMAIPVSKAAHLHEHSSEVILPFIQKYCENDFSFVSIGMARQNPDLARELSAAIVRAANSVNKRLCLIASSDFSHYVKPEDGKKLDQKVLECILRKNVNEIYDEVIDHQLSVCGYGPIMVLSATLNTLHPEARPVVLSRGHSGEVHPSDSVVDYISVLFYKNP